MKKSIAKKVLLKALKEQPYPVPVENVIFWALEYYATKHEDTFGKTISYSIKEKILKAEAKAKRLAKAKQPK
jgi:hypothetical protein